MTMFEFNWQLGAAVLAVVWAAWHVARTVRRTLAKSPGAGGCTTCRSCGKDAPLVELKLHERN